MRTLLALAFLLLSVAPAGAAPQASHPFLDLDFEAAECSNSWWTSGVGNYEAALDAQEAREGRQSQRLRYVGAAPWTEASFGVRGQQFLPVEALAGRRVRITGSIRTEGVTAGSARFWAVAYDAAGRSLAGANGPGASGTTPWTPYEAEIDVPAGAARINFGVLLAGNGTAWFDALTIEVDGRRWVDGRQTFPRPSAAALSWLRKRAIPFTTPEPGHGFRDLQPLKKVIGDARIVSLGEGTHGTREFFQMKHRLVEFLASEMGFTHFAIEANLPEAQKVNEYVLTGEGDPRQLLEGLYFWTWNTQEVLDMILWMREFNRSGRGRIQFLGFDMQEPSVAADNVRAFLRAAEPGYLAEADRALTSVVQAVRLRQAASGAQASQAEQAAAGVLAHLEARRGQYLASHTAEEVEWIVQNARVALQSIQDVAGTVSRDQSMARNVEWILDQAPPDAKIVLWAHNLHVAKIPGWMGKFLADRYGREMVVLGFAFGKGSFNAYNAEFVLGPNVAGAPPRDSVESYLGASRIPRFIVDLRGIPANAPSAAWFRNPKKFRNIGSVVLQCSFDEGVAAEHYDGLIWLERTSPSELLPWD